MSTLRFKRLKAVLVIAAAALANGAAAKPAATDVVSLIEPIRQHHHVPALGAALVSSNGIIASGVTGVRKRDVDVTVTINDKWHLGSNTKAMTAVIVATLVERGKLSWETTIGQVFPELSHAFPEKFRAVTVTQLLSHHAGLPADLDWGDVARSASSLRDQRLHALKTAAMSQLESPPGTKFGYSNLGYTLAGAIAERVAGKPWEDLMREIVFKPLRMMSCGFGGIGTPDKIDQPWPHGEDGRPMAANGPTVDNPEVMGPAGTVHCSIADYSKFIADQLRGERGGGALLKTETYKALHAPRFGDTYAFGWIVLSQDWAGGTVLAHQGTNTLNFCIVRIAPRRGFAVLAVTNQGGDEGQKAVLEATDALIRLYDNR